MSIITLLLKPNIKPLECGSYMPIQVLQVDCKILLLIRSSTSTNDQTGFVKNRFVGDNMWKLVHTFLMQKTCPTMQMRFHSMLKNESDE